MYDRGGAPPQPPVRFCESRFRTSDQTWPRKRPPSWEQAGGGGVGDVTWPRSWRADAVCAGPPHTRSLFRKTPIVPLMQFPFLLVVILKPDGNSRSLQSTAARSACGNRQNQRGSDESSPLWGSLGLNSSD
ncbi:unnamed protein product [Rangifer tarandus platyrhynchus]|uniref:Uncharacterized protein n=2 Tax=Rangifer tarandus platyrhynchus TaxID=3082113 RepID=A0ABN8YC93_RANTA|nr:unnamed protein product [Rangifer tarandus platyrhynchus]